MAQEIDMKVGPKSIPHVSITGLNQHAFNLKVWSLRKVLFLAKGCKRSKHFSSLIVPQTDSSSTLQQIVTDLKFAKILMGWKSVILVTDQVCQRFFWVEFYWQRCRLLFESEKAQLTQKKASFMNYKSNFSVSSLIGSF